MNNNLRTPRTTIYFIKAILPLCIICLCLACGGDPSKSTGSTAIDSTTTQHTDTARQEAVYENDEADEIQFIPKEISASAIGKAKTLAAKTFDPTEALRALYPGNYYTFPADTDSSRTESLVSWRCKACKQEKFNTADGEEPDLFPYPDGNMTMYTDTLQFTDDDGRKNIFLILGTIPVQPREFLYSGRFSCAALNVAWYVAGAGQWQLKMLSPVLGCYGAFQTMPAMHLARLGRNNYGCYLFNTNGGAGGPFYSDFYLFGIVNGEFKTIMQESGVQRFDSELSEWKATIAGKNTTNNFDDLAMTLTGMYSKNLFENDTISNLPKELISYATKKDSLNFIITREYHFANGNYNLSASKIDLK